MDRTVDRQLDLAEGSGSELGRQDDLRVLIAARGEATQLQVGFGDDLVVAADVDALGHDDRLARVRRGGER